MYLSLEYFNQCLVISELQDNYLGFKPMLHTINQTPWGRTINQTMSFYVNNDDNLCFFTGVADS